jgi:hypothetical protein
MAFDDIFSGLFDTKDAAKDAAKGREQNGSAHRDHYQEALVTELLRLLVANSIITRDEAQGVVRRAREVAKDRSK